MPFGSLLELPQLERKQLPRKAGVWGFSFDDDFGLGFILRHGEYSVRLDRLEGQKT